MKFLLEQIAEQLGTDIRVSVIEPSGPGTARPSGS
jgi:hypothetical protein